MLPIQLFTSPLFLEHDPGPGHPEGADRLTAILSALDRAALPLLRREPAPASREALLAVHAPEHLERLEGLHRRGAGQLDPDTRMSAGSWPAALAAAGALEQAVGEAVGSDGPYRAFCAVRPPGHHACRERAMGFCLLNNVACGAARALALGLERVAIFDFDVHHGNGTEEIFYTDARVLYVSTHQYPFYPGSGAARDTGSGEGLGATLNVPLPGGTGDDDYRVCLESLVLPALEAFEPELLLLSAGFDAHRRDPLGGLRLSTAMYAELTAALLPVANRHCGGRIVSVLEGGYDREALAESAVAHVRALATP